jgi:hypothetical protein
VRRIGPDLVFARIFAVSMVPPEFMHSGTARRTEAVTTKLFSGSRWPSPISQPA